MDEKNFNFIGQNVRKWRKAQKLTQEELALRSDMSQGYINQLESGKKGFSRDSLRRVTGALGIPVNSIFRECGPIKIVRSYDKKAGQRDSITRYVVMKQESHEQRRGQEKTLRKGLLELVKQLPENIVEHYVHLMKIEAHALRRKKKLTGVVGQGS